MTLNLMPFQELPFNGDNFICEEFLKLKIEYEIATAVETGSCLYSTTKWLCSNFDKVFTVEINPQYADYGKHKIQEYNNCSAFVSVDSVDFIKTILPEQIDKTKGTIFFLDAHWGDVCPLLDELSAIADLGLEKPPVIAIHDFQTQSPFLGFDTYRGQSFNYDWIENHIKKIESSYSCQYTFYYNTDEQSAGAKRGIIYLTPKQK